MKGWKDKLNPKKLTEQDEKFKDKYKKWLNYTTTLLMVAIFIISSFDGIAYSVVISSFENQMILGAKFAFETKPETPVANLNLDTNLNRTDIKYIKDPKHRHIDSEYFDDDLKHYNQTDLEFLKKNRVDVKFTQWPKHHVKLYSIFYYSALSEIVALVWAVMLLVYQSGTRSFWALPAPWMIVIPSLITFFIMSCMSLAYWLLIQKELGGFCDALKIQLIEPDKVSCGSAIYFLKTYHPDHAFTYDTYLKLIYECGFIEFLCWLISLIIMALRFIFAIDFQLVETTYANTLKLQAQAYETLERRQKQELEAEKDSISDQPIKHIKYDDEDEEDDFYSTRSHNTLDELSAVSKTLLKQSDKELNKRFSEV